MHAFEVTLNGLKKKLLRSVISKFRYDPVTKVWSSPQDISVPNWMNGMVIGAIVMAVLCNLCVLSRFLERHVWHSVVFSLIAATLQGTRKMDEDIATQMRIPRQIN